MTLCVPPRSIRALAQRPIMIHDAHGWDAAQPWLRHVVLRLARHHPILFVSDPIQESCLQPSLQMFNVEPGVVHLLPMVPNHTTDLISQGAMVAPLLRDALRHHPLIRQRFDEAIQWFRSPGTAPIFLGDFGSVGAIYDCATTPAPQADALAGEHLLLRAARLILACTRRLHDLPTRRPQTVHLVTHEPSTTHPASPKTLDDPTLQRTWDGQAATIRRQLLDTFRPAGTAALPAGFVAASALALTAD